MPWRYWHWQLFVLVFLQAPAIDEFQHGYSISIIPVLEHTTAHPVGLLHLVVAVAAIVAGGAVVLYRKGTRLHKWLGRGYVLAMIGVNATSFFIYEVFGNFGLFHWMAIFSLLTVILAYIPARTRGPNWKARHAYLMTASYVGLLAALAAEILTRTPWFPFLGAVAIASSVIIVTGLIMMFRMIPRLL